MKKLIAVFGFVFVLTLAGAPVVFAGSGGEKGPDEKASDVAKEKAMELPPFLRGEMKEKSEMKGAMEGESEMGEEDMDKARAEWLKTLEKLKEEQKEKEEEGAEKEMKKEMKKGSKKGS